jgi:hypothetical protein
MQGQNQSGKNEEHYFNDYPVEMITVLSKVLAEALLSSSSIDEQRDNLPPELYRVISHGIRKSDPAIEQEIYSTYCQATRRRLDDKYTTLVDENKKLCSQIERLKSSEGGENGVKSRLKNLSKASESLEQKRVNSAEEADILKKNPSAGFIEGKRVSATLGPRLHSANRRSAAMQQRQTLSVSRTGSQPEPASNIEV